MDSDWFTTSLATAAERLLEMRLVKPIIVPPPNPGSDFIAKVPGGVIWELIFCRFTFVTSAVVANRRPALRLSDADGLVYMNINTQVDVAATTSFAYNFAQGVGYENTAAGALYGLPTPPIAIPPGWSINTNTTLLDVGDQYSAIRLLVREWSETDIVQEMVEMSQQLDSLTLPEVTGRNV